MEMEMKKPSPESSKPWEPNRERLDSMQRKISEDPRLLSRAAGKPSCCIFRAPTSLFEVNGRAYQPHIVSIGPYHRGDPSLEMIQEHKWRYLGSLLSRTQAFGVFLEDIMKAIEPLVPAARECYSEVIHLDTDEFIEMMVLDGLFMIELFRKMSLLVPFEPNDPLVTMVWIFPLLYEDFIRLKNQIPYLILECLFERTKVKPQESEHSLAKLALKFFNSAMQRSNHDISGRYLLDLVRSSYMPQANQLLEQPRCAAVTHLIPCVSMLRQAGVKICRPNSHESFLVVKFQDGMLEMPSIYVNEFMSSFLLNCMAYEQCHHSSSKHITTYVFLLDCPVNTYKDVKYLCNWNIIENDSKTYHEVAKFFKNLGKEVVFDIDECYLARVFNDVHAYYCNSWHVQWANNKHLYFNFDTPWSFISVLAAILLLVMTLIQTLYTVYGFYAPNGP